MKLDGVEGAQEAWQMVRAHRPDVRDHTPPGWIKPTTEHMKNIQKTEPVKWAMTLPQWHEFVDFCKNTLLFSEIKMKKPSHVGSFVNLYDLQTYFVKPWTRRTGCGIALHRNS